MQVCKIKFKKMGRRYFFSTTFDTNDGDQVVVETIRGLEVGTVVGEVLNLDENQIPNDLKKVIRIATKDDLNKLNKNKTDEVLYFKEIKSLIKDQCLDMKLLTVEYTLDRSKLIISFESEERVDFRDFIKILIDKYKSRIELRQVGSRDGAKAFGGIGPCGLIVCCQTFLMDFSNVSIKMAKNQGLSLNPTKISGNCGKLLCCINYENETYLELRKTAPIPGDLVDTENGKAKVLTSDVLNKKLKVRYFTTETFGYLTYDDVKIIKVNKE
ncbi:MAG: PSP1 domain-containing protein [Anaeroplasmataceae bacterium]